MRRVFTSARDRAGLRARLSLSGRIEPYGRPAIPDVYTKSMPTGPNIFVTFCSGLTRAAAIRSRAFLTHAILGMVQAVSCLPGPTHAHRHLERQFDQAAVGKPV